MAISLNLRRVLMTLWQVMMTLAEVAC